MSSGCFNPMRYTLGDQASRLCQTLGRTEGECLRRTWVRGPAILGGPEGKFLGVGDSMGEGGGWGRSYLLQAWKIWGVQVQQEMDIGEWGGREREEREGQRCREDREEGDRDRVEGDTEDPEKVGQRP